MSFRRTLWNDLAAAFNTAPDFFSDKLCSPDGIFIVQNIALRRVSRWMRPTTPEDFDSKSRLQKVISLHPRRPRPAGRRKEHVEP
jgi:hypothetical protein